MPALAKEEVADEDMAEMIASEIGSLSNQLKELEGKIKVVIFCWFSKVHMVKIVAC